MRIVSFLSTLVIGFGSGMAVGYLTAPATGKRTRKLLAMEFDTYKDKFEEKANEKLNEARAILNEVKESPLANKGKKVVETVVEKTKLN